MSARWASTEAVHQDPLIFGGICGRSCSFGAIVTDESIGKYQDSLNVGFYGGYLICESVASREVGEIIIRAINEAIVFGEIGGSTK